MYVCFVYCIKFIQGGPPWYAASRTALILAWLILWAPAHTMTLTEMMETSCVPWSQEQTRKRRSKKAQHPYDHNSITN